MTVAPVMLRSDVDTWRRLIAAARSAARSPKLGYVAHAFAHQVKTARYAVMPIQTPEAQRPFLHLLGFATRWTAMDRTGRAANAAPVLRLANACALLIGDPAETRDDDPTDPPPDAGAARRLPYRDDTFEEDAA